MPCAVRGRVKLDDRLQHTFYGQATQIDPLDQVVGRKRILCSDNSLN